MAFSVFSAPGQNSTVSFRDDFKRYYDKFNVDGSFVLYDQDLNSYTFYNREQFEQPFIPASTFKIFNSLVGLETGVMTDENFILPWDSTSRTNPSWNCDQDLKTAFKNSTVWYYQELARRVGSEQIKYWLDTVHYGNADTTGGIDQFWLTGKLRISPKQQIDFLRGLQSNQLPFSQRSMDIVKRIMIVSDTSDYILRAKTGWGMQYRLDVGWYIGYVETKNNVYYFANCIQTSDFDHKNFATARIEIANLILAKLNVIRK